MTDVYIEGKQYEFDTPACKENPHGELYFLKRKYFEIQTNTRKLEGTIYHYGLEAYPNGSHYRVLHTVTVSVRVDESKGFVPSVTYIQPGQTKILDLGKGETISIEHGAM